MGDTYIWTGGETSTLAGGNHNVDDPANWFDNTTKSAATHAPAAGDTAVFSANAQGIYPDGTSDGSGGFILNDQEFAPATLEVLNGAQVSLIAGANSPDFHIGTLQLASGGSLTLNGASMQVGATDIGAGATLDLSQAYWIGASLHAPPPAAQQSAVQTASGLGYTGALNGIGGSLTLEQGGSLVLGNAGFGVTSFINRNATATAPLAGVSGAGTLVEPNGVAAQGELPAGPACFVAGTRVLTDGGERAVETLAAGDTLRTAAGRLAPVRWVGRMTVDPRRDRDAAPVCITAGAFAPGVPCRDLLVSGDHAVLIDGVLIPARALVNGATIRRAAATAPVLYVHVELDRHDVLLAEGLAAETYLDTGNRARFAAERGVVALSAEQRLADSLAAYAAHGCAPLCLEGVAVRRAHRRLLLRARTLGWRLGRHAVPVLMAAGRALPPLRRADGLLEYRIAAGVDTVRLVSRSFVPTEIDPAQSDRRCLGVAVALWQDDAPLPEPAFTAGWYRPDPGCAWRWSDGDASLRLAGAGRLVMKVMPAGGRYWLPPTPRMAARRRAA